MNSQNDKNNTIATTRSQKVPGFSLALWLDDDKLPYICPYKCLPIHKQYNWFECSVFSNVWSDPRLHMFHYITSKKPEHYFPTLLKQLSCDGDNNEQRRCYTDILNHSWHGMWINCWHAACTNSDNCESKWRRQAINRQFTCSPKWQKQGRTSHRTNTHAHTPAPTCKGLKHQQLSKATGGESVSVSENNWK